MSTSLPCRYRAPNPHRRARRGRLVLWTPFWSWSPGSPRRLRLVQPRPARWRAGVRECGLLPERLPSAVDKGMRLRRIRLIELVRSPLPDGFGESGAYPVTGVGRRPAEPYPMDAEPDSTSSAAQESGRSPAAPESPPVVPPSAKPSASPADGAEVAASTPDESGEALVDAVSALRSRFDEHIGVSSNACG